MVFILHERKEQEFGGYKAEDRKLIQSSNVIGTSTSLTELDMFTRFLRNNGAHLIIRNVCYLFLGLRSRLSKGKGKGFK